MKKVIGLLLVFLMISVLVCGCSMPKENKEESLDSEVYKDELKAFEDIIPIPEFEIKSAIITDDRCSFYSSVISQDEYEAYVKQIRGRGFTEDVVKIGDTYKAKNGNGYRFRCYYDDDSCFFSLRPEN